METSLSDHPRGAVCVAIHRPNPVLLAVQLASIRAQTCTDWTAIVSIDGQDPETTQLVCDLIDGDQRFEVHEFRENVGHYRNFERLLRLVPSDVEWCALSDQDDNCYPEKLAILTSTLKARGATAVVGGARLVDDTGKPIGYTGRRSVPLWSLILDNQVTGSLAVFDRRVIDCALPFPRPTPVAYHDHWLGVVAASLGRIEYLEEVVQDYVQHRDNVLGEPLRGNVVSRLRSFRQQSGHTVRGAMAVVAQERWGWRVTMARELSLRIGPELRDDRLLDAIAHGGPSLRLTRAIGAAILGGDIEPARGGALVAGQVIARMRRDRGIL